MWPLYVSIALLVIIGVIVYYRSRKKIIPEPAPEQKYLIVKIENNTENIQKVYTLEDNQVIVVFKQDIYIETINNSDFSISEFASKHQLNARELNFKSYHFYVFNQSLVANLSLKMEKAVRIADVEYGIPIGIIPKGKVSLEYTDIPLLFRTFNLFRNKYSYTDFFDDLRIHFQKVVTRGIIQFCYENKVSFIVLNYFINELEKHIKTLIDAEIFDYGLKTTMVEFIEFIIQDSEELKKLDLMMLQKQKFVLLKYSYVDEKKKQLMDKIDFHQKARVNKQELSSDVKNII